MANDYTVTLETFEARLRHFMFMFDNMKKENAALKTQLAQKNDELLQLEAQLKQQEAQYTDLMSARLLTLYDNDIESTKKRLNGLIHEVDKCIAMLKS